MCAVLEQAVVKPKHQVALGFGGISLGREPLKCEGGCGCTFDQAAKEGCV